MQVTPRTLAGFVELLPNEQIVFDKMMNTVKMTMELNGLVSLDTPVLELSEVLLAKAGGETEKQVYTVLRATFKYKDSREQFEIRTHKRLIYITNPQKGTIDALRNLDLPSGVEIDIKL